MRIARLCTGLILGMLCLGTLCLCLSAEMSAQEMTVTGQLTRVMAIGGESTGWTIQLDSEATIDGKQVPSIEVDSRKTKKLEKLENKHVEATGLLSHRHGVETGERTILALSSIKEAQVTAQAPANQAPAQTAPVSLVGSEWLLEDLGGQGVIDTIQPTLTFPEAGRVAGNGSCNRFFGPAEMSGNTIKLGPLASSRMACPEAAMNQEKKYLDALQTAERFEQNDADLLIYCKGFEKPLRFTRKPNRSSTAP